MAHGPFTSLILFLTVKKEKGWRIVVREVYYVVVEEKSVVRLPYHGSSDRQMKKWKYKNRE